MVSKVGVVGPGRMGRGITVLLMLAGCSVELVHHNRIKLGLACEQIKAQIHQMKRRDPDSISRVMQLLIPQPSVANLLTRNHLVIETISEDLEAKQQLFRQLNIENGAGTAILASNTSSLTIRELSAAGHPQWKHRFIGLHFLNPVLENKLVEIVPLPTTDPPVLAAIQSFVTRLNKEYIVCKDQPGFVVNRLLTPFLTAAIDMVKAGNCSAQDIEKACRLGLRHPTSPLKLVDLIGKHTFDIVAKRLQNLQ